MNNFSANPYDQQQENYHRKCLEICHWELFTVNDYWFKYTQNWNVILKKFSSLAALEVVILTTSNAANDENFIKMTTFPFQCNNLLLSRTNHLNHYWPWPWCIIHGLGDIFKVFIIFKVQKISVWQFNRFVDNCITWCTLLANFSWPQDTLPHLGWEKMVFTLQKTFSNIFLEWKLLCFHYNFIKVCS